MDYRKYQCEISDYALCVAVAAAFTSVVAWLFYHSMLGLLLLPLVYGYALQVYKGYRGAKQRSLLLSGFKEGMMAVSAALMAGYSMENAWKEAEHDLVLLYGMQRPIVKEFIQINSLVGMNQPLEEALTNFALRSGCEDIESFAEIFSFAKRGGGDFAAIIQTTVQRLGAKIEVEREIQTTIAGKKFESRIMCMMPLFLLAYMNCTSMGFLQPLYGNLTGALLMTAALAVYAGAVWWSGKMMDIRV